jgi:hypothetical protein
MNAERLAEAMAAEFAATVPRTDEQWLAAARKIIAAIDLQ